MCGIYVRGIKCMHLLSPIKKKPATQTVHLVFADTKANAKKPKELFFANAHRE